MSRARRALPRCGAPLSPRALPRAHAPLPRDRRARARSLRRRRRRLGCGSPRAPCGAVWRASPPVDPIALAFWLELLGAPDPALAPSELEPEARRARLFQSLGDLIQARARARAHRCSGSRTCTVSTRRATPALEMLTGAAPGSGVGRQQGAAARDHAARVPARVGRPGRASLACALAARDASTLLDDWLGPDPALAPLRARIEARAQRQSPLRRGDRSLARRARRAARRARRVRAGRPGRGDRAARDRPGRPGVAHRSARAARQGRAPGRGGGRATTCRRSCCAPWSICPEPSSPRRSSGS